LASITTFVVSTPGQNARYDRLVADQASGDIYAAGSVGTTSPRLLVSRYNSSAVHQSSITIDVGATTQSGFFQIIEVRAVELLATGEIVVAFHNYDKSGPFPFEVLIIESDLSSASAKSFGAATDFRSYGIAVNASDGSTYYTGGASSAGWTREAAGIIKGAEAAAAGATLDCYPEYLVSDETYSLAPFALAPSTTAATFVTDTTAGFATAEYPVVEREIRALC
jgi:hypothetical protein